MVRSSAKALTLCGVDGSECVTMGSSGVWNHFAFPLVGYIPFDLI